MPCPQAHKAHRRSFPLWPTLQAVPLLLLLVLLLVLPALLTEAAGQARQAGRQVGYSAPTPLIEALSPRGLRVTIPDEAGISLVRFHVGVNKPLSAQRLGTVNVEVSQPTGSLWAYEDRTTVLGAGDVLYFWLQVTLAGHAYERAGTYAVEDAVEMYDVVGAPVLSRPLAESPAPPAQRPQQRLPEADSVQPCTRSLTSVNGRLVCQGELLFLENFDAADLSTGPWRHDVRIAGPPDFEFTTFTHSEANTYAVNGQLVIRPTLTDDVYGRDFVRTGKLRLENCTAGALESELCSRQARYGYILPPVLSGRISTRKTFSFRYGVVEVRAKLPSGDWIYPELWLLPREEAYGTGLKSGRIQLALARGNMELHHGATELGLRRLEAGAIAAAPNASPAGHEQGQGQGEQEVETEEDDRVEAAEAVPPHGVELEPSISTRFGDQSPALAGPEAATAARGPPPTTSTTTSSTTSTTTSTTAPRSTTTLRTTTSTARVSSAKPPSPVTVASRSAAPAKPTAASRSAPTVSTGLRTTASASTARPASTPPRKPSPTTAAAAQNGNGRGAARGGTAPAHKPPPGSSPAAAGGTGTSSPGGSASRGGSQTNASGQRPTPSSHAPYQQGEDEDGWRPRPRHFRSVRSPAGYRGPLRKEVSRTELPGRPWSGGFHNYTLRWTPDAMIFSVDGVELGAVLPEESGGVFRTSADDPWHHGGTMAPFDREFFVSLGLAVGGIHTFPEGVEGPNRHKKPWKNTAAKAMLGFWNAQADWYQSWSTDSALLVDFVQVTAL